MTGEIPGEGSSQEHKSTSRGPDKRRVFYVGKKHVRTEKQPKNPDSGGTKPPEKDGGVINDGGVDKIVTAINESASKISGTIETESEITRKKLEELNEKVVRKMEEIRELQSQLNTSLDPKAVNNAIDELYKNLKPVIDDLKKAMDSVVNISKDEIAQLKTNEGLMRAYLDQMESQIPEELKNPTPDRWKDPTNPYYQQKPPPNDAYKIPRYQNYVVGWFEDRLQTMESFEQSFEEQGDIYRYLSLYVNNFLLRPETKKLGEKLRDKLETRRIAHRTARIWDLSPPDQIMSQGSMITFTTLGKMFKEGGPQAQNELRNYERMGRILRERRDELANLVKIKSKRELSANESDRLIELKKEVKAKELYILDYYKLGGAEEDCGIEDAYTTTDDKYNGKTGDQSNDNKDGYFYRLGRDFVYDETTRGDLIENRLKNLDPEDPKAKELRKKVWAKKYAGKLWSISFRAAQHDVLLNGTGDFYASRVMNFADRLRSNVLMRDSSTIWDPDNMSYANKPFSIGYIDVITDITKKLDRSDTESVGILVDSSGEKDMRGENIRTLENFEWCSDEDGHSVLWDEALAKPETRSKEGVVAVRYTRFNDADATRKKLWGADSFFHKPTMEGLIGMEAVFVHMGTDDAVYEIRDATGNVIATVEGISGIEAKWIELLDRSLDYLKTDKAEDWLGNPITGYAEKATIRHWIRSAAKNGMINSDTQEKLLIKHLGTSNTWRLNRITEISVLWNDFKKNIGGMSLQAFMEFLRRAFGYVFTDDLKS